MDVLNRRIAVLKLISELWVAIAGIYFFLNLKAIFVPDGLTDPGALWTPLIGLGVTLAATISVLVVLLRRAAAQKSR